VEIEGVHPHDLRHYAGTTTARTPGVTTEEIMSRMGHSSARAALIYQHATQERDEAVADYLGGVISQAKRVPKSEVVHLRSQKSRAILAPTEEPGYWAAKRSNQGR
jgi:hypothetical protein